MFQPYMGRNMQETIIIYDDIINKVLCVYLVWLFSTNTRKLWDIKNRHLCFRLVESSWNVTAHGDAREGKWRGKWRMEWVASTLHTTSEHGVSRITTADAHTSATSSRLNWSPRRFKWTRPFRRKTKSGFCPCVVTFQTQSTCLCSCEKHEAYGVAVWFHASLT